MLDAVAYVEPQIAQTTPEWLPVWLSEVGDFVLVEGNEVPSGPVEGWLHLRERYQIPLLAVPLVVPGNAEMLRDARRSDHPLSWDRG